MTDLPDGSGQVDRGTGRRSSRVGDSGSPVGSTLSIILAVVAVVAGFLILREVFDEDGSGSSGLEPPGSAAEGADTTTPGSDASSPTTPAPTTTERAVRSATIVVANASGIGGSAGQMTTALEAVGYRLGEATDSTEGQMDNSVVYFVRGDREARATADSVAQDMGGLRVRAMPDDPPISGELGNATVLLMLGTDAAGKTLAELNPTQVPAPSVAGSATTTG